MVTIDDVKYTGKSPIINQVVTSNFTVYFKSKGEVEDDELQLEWHCTKWAEWASSQDGTCRQIMRPLNNGSNTIGHLKYRKSNQTCSKAKH